MTDANGVYTPNNNIMNTPQTDIGAIPGIMSLEKFNSQIGVTRETMFKWRKEGMLETINIYGRLYVTTEEAARFKQRALSGEFAKTIKGPRSQ